MRLVGILVLLGALTIGCATADPTPTRLSPATAPAAEPLEPTPAPAAPQPTAIVEAAADLDCPGDAASFVAQQLTGNVFTRDLRCADFLGATLIDVEFAGALLDGANFAGARLEAVSFDGTALRQADFSAALLTDVEFEDSDLTGAQVANWSLTNVEFESTICPNGQVSGTETADC